MAKTVETSGGGVSIPEAGIGDSDSDVSASLATGYDGAAIGFGIIAGSSLIALTLLLSNGTTKKKF